MMTLDQVTVELSRRLVAIFLRDGDGRRAVFGARDKLQSDPLWRDYLLFHEYFHGDSGAGLGASHQTGWTALVGKLLQQSGTRFEDAAQRLLRKSIHPKASSNAAPSKQRSPS